MCFLKWGTDIKITEANFVKPSTTSTIQIQATFTNRNTTGMEGNLDDHLKMSANKKRRKISQGLELCARHFANRREDPSIIDRSNWM